MGVEEIIAKAICAFLNSDGGLLFIGVRDDGTIQGLEESDFTLTKKLNKKDYFKNEFDRMIGRFLSFSIKSKITGKFIELDDKTIYVVDVEQSKNRPVFLKKTICIIIDEENETVKQTVKQFFVRGEASTRPLDMEEFLNYYIDKWGTK